MDVKWSESGKKEKKWINKYNKKEKKIKVKNERKNILLTQISFQSASKI